MTLVWQQFNFLDRERHRPEAIRQHDPAYQRGLDTGDTAWPPRREDVIALHRAVGDYRHHASPVRYCDQSFLLPLTLGSPSSSLSGKHSGSVDFPTSVCPCGLHGLPDVPRAVSRVQAGRDFIPAVTLADQPRLADHDLVFRLNQFAPVFRFVDFRATPDFRAKPFENIFLAAQVVAVFTGNQLTLDLREPLSGALALRQRPREILIAVERPPCREPYRACITRPLVGWSGKGIQCEGLRGEPTGY